MKTPALIALGIFLGLMFDFPEININVNNTSTPGWNSKQQGYYDDYSYEYPDQPVPPPYNPPKDQLPAEPEIEKEVGGRTEGVLLTF